MKCSSVCYCLRIHILVLMGLIALGCAAQLGGFATARPATSGCEPAGSTVCAESARANARAETQPLPLPAAGNDDLVVDF